MKNNIDWKRKLTSRKFWMAVAGFISGVITLLASEQSSPEAITGLVMQGASVISYIIGEGLADSAPTENYYIGSEEE